MRRITWLPLAVLLYVTLSACLATGHANAAPLESTGPHPFASIVDDASAGSVPWSAPSNAMLCDGQRTEAVFTSPGQDSHDLRAVNVGLSVPSAATVTGIEVSLEVRASGGLGADGKFVLTLLKNGLPIAMEVTQPITSTTDVTYTLGPGSWNTIWTPTDLNASNFGIQLYAYTAGAQTIGIDCLSANAYYWSAQDHALYMPLLSRP
jgi:hypothetical protein